MNSLRILLLLTICMIFASPAAFPQPMSAIVEGDENWVTKDGVYYGWFFYVRPDRYSASDVAGFREKFRALKSFDSDRDWSGAYFSGTEQTVDHMKLLIDSDRGYAEFSVYTCLPELRYIDFGTVVETDEFIQLVPDRPQGSTRKTSTVKYVKVRWGKERLLVNELSLEAFAEKAVGIYVQPDDPDNPAFNLWANFHVQGVVGDDDESSTQFPQSIVGLPEFPNSYRRAMRVPIETRLLTVGKRIVRTDVEIGNTTYSEVATYKVTLRYSKGMKKGMIFEIPDSTDEIQITTIERNLVTGLLVRDLDEEKNDQCFDPVDGDVACKKLTANLIVRTKVADFSY